MTFTPTAEQQAILSAATSRTESLMITAYAGCSKTTTLELVSKALDPATPVLYVVFNKKNQLEAEKRFARHVTVKTLNGLGHSAWGRAVNKRLTVDDRKQGRLVTQAAKDLRVNLGTDDWASVRQLVASAMLAGVVPQGYPQPGLLPDCETTWQDLAAAKWLEVTPAQIEVARVALRASVAESFAGVISFDDQIYMPAMFNGQFERYALVMVDESQDLNALQHRMVQRTAAGRLIIVGDPKQAIYQFRGADTESMGKLRALRSEWIDLPLNTTFRCPKLIVARHQAHAPGFTAHESNHEGQFVALPAPRETEVSDHTWTWRDVSDLVNGHTVAVLCRNNAPLLAMAFKLIRQGIAPQMLGRDIGKGLVALSKKILPEDETPARDCLRLINAWAQAESSLAIANDNETKLEGINDRAECLRAVLEFAKAPHAIALREALAGLFARESGRVTLATGHRAKGLEWDAVVHLDPWRIPSKYATKPAQQEQERNLRYVLETRAKRLLIEADLEQFGHD